MKGTPLFGLVLAGGESRRMGQDKAALCYEGQPQLARAVALLSGCVEKCFVSVREGQKSDTLRAEFPLIADPPGVEGPAAGLLAAHAFRPDLGWLVVACDMPLLDPASIRALIAARDPAVHATAFRSPYNSLPEPLCTIWEPAALALLHAQTSRASLRPRDVLAMGRVKILDPLSADALDNVNTVPERQAAERLLACRRNGIRAGMPATCPGSPTPVRQG